MSVAKRYTQLGTRYDTSFIMHGIDTSSGKFKGLVSNVARKLGVTREFVSRVLHGRKTSTRVTKALRAEIRRIDRREGK